MSQERLNSVIVCHVHQDILDNLDIHKIADDFAGRSFLIFGSLYLAMVLFDYYYVKQLLHNVLLQLV